MSEPTSKSDAVLELAEEFLERYRRGERPAISEYVSQFPELEAEIREIFPAMAMIENIALEDATPGGNAGESAATDGGKTLLQLGDYRIIREVGRGGMGVVYEAEQISLSRHVALKVLPSHGLLNPTYLERFRREAKAAARLHHTNIVPVFGTGEENGTHYYAMQFIRGESLDRVLRDVRRLRRAGTSPSSLPPALATNHTQTLDLPSKSPPTSSVAETSPSTPSSSSGLSLVGRFGTEYHQSVTRIGLQAAEALAYAYKQGVLHRDIKPSNLLLDMQGTVWITDFGLAKADGDDLTQTGDIVGTIRYMAPERFEGKSLPQSDVYSLGITLYELLTLRPAFDGQNRAKQVEQVLHESVQRPRKIDASIPRDLETIVLKCVVKDPNERYASADALAEDLRQFLAHRPILARRATPWEQIRRWARRNPAIAGLLSLLFLLLASISVASALVAVNMKRLAESAEVARDRERWERYRSNIAAASAALQLQNSSGVRRALDAAPDQFRNWEWQHLHSQLDGARAVLRGNGAAIRSMAISPDARWLASLPFRGPVHLWHLPTGRDAGELGAAGENVTSISFGPTGILAVAHSANGQSTVRLWGLVHRRVVQEFSTRGNVNNLAWSPDGKLLAVHASGDRGIDGHVVVWDTGVSRPIGEAVAAGSYFGLAFRPGASQLARCLQNELPSEWDVKTGKELSFKGATSSCSCLAYSPDGSRLAAGTVHPKNSVLLWDAANGKLISLMAGHTNTVVAVAFNADGSRLASCSMDQTVRLWDANTGRLINVLAGHSGEVRSGAFTPDGKLFVSASLDGTLRVWNAVDGGLVAVLRGHNDPVVTVAVSPDGRTIASGSDDGTIRLWDRELAIRNGVLRGHNSFVYDVAIRPDGNQVASASWDGTVRIWDPTTGRETGVLRVPDANAIVGCVAYHPDGKRLVSVSRDDLIRIWDLAAKKPIRDIHAPTGSWIGDVRAAFNPAGTILAVGSSRGTVRLFDPETGKLLDALVITSETRGEQTATVRDVAFSPDGALLAVTCFDYTVHIWDVATRRERLVLQGDRHPIYAIAFSADGSLLAAADAAGTVCIWETSTSKELKKLPHSGRVFDVSFSPDGTRLAAACADNTIRLWDLATFQEVAELRGHTSYVHAVAWSPDGTQLISGSGDGTVRIWDSISVRERAVRADRTIAPSP